MRSARRRKLLSRREKEKSILPVILKFLVPVFIILAAWVFLKVSTKYWNGTDKVSYVFREGNGDVAVTVLDPKLSELTTLIIPGDTQINVAGNYGTLRIKNVWQLGINEKLGGSLLAATVTKNFLMPTFLWSEGSADSVKFIIAPVSTNIPLGDRLHMTIFSMQVKGVNQTIVDLGKSQFLKKVNLNDGAPGYILSGPVSERITAYFSDNDFGDKGIRVEIVDTTGAPGSANTVGQIVEVLGGKVVSIDRKTVPTDTDCVVLGTNPRIVRKIATMFGCKTTNENSVFDLEIRLGAQFAKRF